MHIGKLPAVKHVEEPQRFPQTVSKPEKAVLENEKLSLSLERTETGEFVVDYNNKLDESTIGCTLVETYDLSKATKVLHVFKEGVRFGSTTKTVI